MPEEPKDYIVVQETLDALAAEIISYDGLLKGFMGLVSLLVVRGVIKNADVGCLAKMLKEAKKE